MISLICGSQSMFLHPSRRYIQRRPTCGRKTASARADLLDITTIFQLSNIINRRQTCHSDHRPIVDNTTRAFYQEVAPNNHRPRKHPAKQLPPYTNYQHPITTTTTTSNPPPNPSKILNNGPPQTSLHPPRHPLSRPLNMARSYLPHQEQQQQQQQQQAPIQIQIASTATNPLAHIRRPNTRSTSKDGARGSLPHVWRLRCW